ncbi:Solanesyl diphosphate synthase 3, chloroplastic/mitochondrial [Cymbomonas tetramitiformis]|uniref:Solanesyl diphosphate synthase 3, chloroplastic/mitochondrial n=1 Tax=Cymbomonas tetramitiformis TaxID=36881 RepID=A0AAE0BN81_9CHLO|nr:Solanesyl diphosphate synthase 3, chloroplastic/mitochondrial [Cymbomonas tetramitiformis]
MTTQLRSFSSSKQAQCSQLMFQAQPGRNRAQLVPSFRSGFSGQSRKTLLGSPQADALELSRADRSSVAVQAVSILQETTSEENREPQSNALASSSDGESVSLADLPRIPIATITGPCQADMDQMNKNLRTIVGERHPLLLAAADQIFGAGGKKLRPMLVFLIAHATAQKAGLTELTQEHLRLAEITEMIHTASLVHDDVLDECNVRRGAETINSMYGTRVAVLAGDFLFAQSSWYLANLDNLEVIKLISQVIADFAHGEISQAASLFDCDVTFEEYTDKSFFKTASLIAASCRSAAVFSGMPDEVKQDMYDYGKHLGLAFQVVDDILDFTQTEEQLGKPQGQDLASGNLTAPVLFAMQGSNELREIIETEFLEEGSLQRALELVETTGGIEKSRELAKQEGQKALDALHSLPHGEYRRSLEGMVGYVLERLY